MTLLEAAIYYKERAQLSTVSWPIRYDGKRGRLVCLCGGFDRGSYRGSYRSIVHLSDCRFAEAEKAIEKTTNNAK